MNRLILPFLLAFGCCTIGIQAQVTIDQNNFPRQAEFLDSFAIDRFVETLPTEGAAQIWDYSALQEDEIIINSYTDATADTELEGALNFKESLLFFLGSIIPRVEYDGIDEAGFYDFGAAIEDVTFSLSSASGNSSDSIRYVGKKAAFEGRLDYLQFPVTYEKQWEGVNVERINIELSIAAFGLDKTPAELKREETQQRAVVGYGQLVLPKKEGTPTDPVDALVIVDALLIKVEQSFVDSFFLAGAPAPTELLDVFNLTQGVPIIESSSRYLFYSPDFASPLLAIGFNAEEEVTFINYRPQVAEVTTSIKAINWQSLKSFPNPVKAGRTIAIQTKILTPIGYFQLSDLSGRIVHQQSFEAPTNGQFSIQIPATTNPGLYFYHLFGQNSEPIGRGKLQVN